MSNKVLIIGGCGFVGGNLYKAASNKGLKAIMADRVFEQKFNSSEFYHIELMGQSPVMNLF